MYRLHSLDFYLLRSPKLPLDQIEEFLKMQDKQLLERFFKSLYGQEFLKQGLFLSSESLYLEVEKWLSGENTLSEKLAKTLYKYTVRLSSRCTPYGHFAGIHMGEISETQNNVIDIIRNQQDIVRYRPDMQFLVRMMQHISKDHHIKNQLTYSLNCTLYRQGKHYKFYQQIPNADANTHYLSQTPATPIIDYIITEKIDSKSYIDWVSLIQSKGADKDQASKFVENLIDSQILLSEMHCQLTAENNFNEILKIMQTVDTKNIYLPTLNKLNKLLTSNYPLIEKQRKIEAVINQKIPETKTKNLLQGDLLLGIETNTIPKKTIKRILNQFQELIPLTTSILSKELEQFKKNFINRFEGQMVRLLEVLDPDTGVGYGSSSFAYSSQDSLLKGINPQPLTQKQAFNNPLEDLVYRRYLLNCVKQDNREVRLQESDLQNVISTINNDTSIPSLYAIGNLLLENNTTAPVFCLQAYGGTSAGNLITRFGYLDKQLQTKLEQLGGLEQESYPDAIVAEIVHLPESRTGNILQRPNIREAEIVLMARANKEVIRINLNELYLFVQKNRIVLWSKKLNREIIPRLTSAHNFQNGINLYRFLADLQFQDQPMSVKWEWVNLGKLPFLPRIRYKNIILSRARWNISKFENAPNCYKEKKRNLTVLKNKYNLPDQVVLVEGDNELLLDLSNPIAVDIFFEKVTKQDITLNEFIFSEFPSPVKDDKGNYYSNEVIIPISIDVKRAQSNIAPKPNCNQRIYALGSDWIYVKIYCGIRCAENLLMDPIAKLVQALQDKNLLKKWFFIRYKDPDPHLRLRFEVESPDKFGSIVQLVNEFFSCKLSDHSIINIQFDTYKREVERYTPEYMELSEQLFHKESEFVLSTIMEIPTSSDRWNICLKYMDSMLNNASLTLLEKHAFSEEMRSAFAREFGNDKSKEKKLNQIFRERKTNIELSLSAGFPNPNIILPLQHFKVISEKIEHEKISADEILSKKSSLLSSYIHMFINRLYPSDQRLYEYAFYHLINSYYQMLIGKSKSLNENKP
ncbi:lantibiotic dehydratase [Sphingobacterium daejeonense]|uniref:lantibiotic dehydratase n=1 Tax=Sphingobacterium daejeonense TaxID=371142 RepID=UPI0021A6C991|nr:lantibiotic dehydratase [Sphingobacterium daejeonense]MCT1531346.1 lantibiotic dehydratase [Sphingobacterium daejeonense]